VQRRRKRGMAKPEGPSGCFGRGSFVGERKARGEARRAEPTSIFSWRLTKNAKFYPHSLAIGRFQGNQYVILSSTVLFRAITFQITVLPPSWELILGQIDRKSLKMTNFSKNGNTNMAETCASKT